MDIAIGLDFIENVGEDDPFAYPEFVSVVNFIKNYLVNYPNEGDFWEILNRNLVNALLTETIPTTFGVEYNLDQIVDAVSVEIAVAPGSSLVNFPRQSLVIGSPAAGGIEFSEAFSFQIPDYGLDHQGGAIVDISIDLDFKKDVAINDPFAYPEFVSVVNVIKNYLLAYPNETDFWEILNRNLVNTLLTEIIPTTFGAQYELDQLVDSLTLRIDVEAGSSLVNFDRASEVKGSPNGASIDFDEAFSFVIEDYGLDHQGGAIVDIEILFDFKKDVAVADPFAYPEFVSVVNFIKNYLESYPNETDFWEILNKNLATEMLTEVIPTTFGAEYRLNEILDSLTLDIKVDSGSSLVNYNRASQVKATPQTGAIDLDESFSFQISDYGLDHQGGAVVDILIDMDFKEGVGDNDPYAYPEFVSIVNFITKYLTSYPNETDFWEILNKNLSAALLTQIIPTSFGVEYRLAEVVESLNVDIQVHPGSSLVNFPRVSSISQGTEAGPALQNLGKATFAISDPSGSNPNLELKLLESSLGIVRDLCVFRVDDEQGRINGIAPGQAGYTRAALQRASSAMAVLASDASDHDPKATTRRLNFEDGDRLRFMLIKKNSLDDLVHRGRGGTVVIGDEKNLTIKETAAGYNLEWAIHDGPKSQTKDLVFEIKASRQEQPLGSEIQAIREGELIDLRDFDSSASIAATFTVSRASAVDSQVGFYKINSTDGSVIDPITSQTLRPGDRLYAEAAMRNRAAGIGLTAADQSQQTINGSLQGGSLWAPYLIVKGTPEQLLDGIRANDPAVYFPFIKANGDRLDHIRLGANNTFYFEDRRGGGSFSFDDIIVSASFAAIG